MKINKKLLMAALASAVIVTAPQAKAYTLSNAESVATNTGIGLSQQKSQAAVRAEGNEVAQKAPQQATDPNYAEDEAKIKDFSDSERYRSTQLEQGGGPYTSFINKENINEFIDGFRYRNLEPSATSPDKTLWGFELELDKEKAQRTYTDFYFTNTGNLAAFVNTGSIPANDAGKRIGKNFKDPTYKSTAEIIVDGQRAQRNFNLFANEEDLKYINSIENKNIVMAWQSNYLKDNPNGPLWATQGPSSAYGFTVNPWPNENDMLSLIKLNGSHNKKEFVQGQTITTDITIENLDDNARKRLVGQVYHPITGEIVPGAKAYINNQDKVVIEMPKGAVDENGNINKDSIFYSDPKYKALQNLEVKFFARPRTAEEFTKIANDNEGTYTPTGAGTATINHKGEKVEIDLQGIDRYDHYNEIGRFKINLDDTRYYDQGFIDGNKDDTTKHTSSAVKPGEEFEVKLYVPEDKKDKDLFPNQKTPEEMETAKDENQAVGTIDWQYINQINKGKKPEDQWKLEYDESTLPTTFKITPPASAKAGDFVAVPLTYTYTNGSTDVHWFHFVVQESTNNVPEYYVQVEYPSEEQKSTPKLPENPDDKKLTPQSYSIPEGTEFKDNKGNEWTVSIDNTTGEVTAKPNDPSKFDGGETLTVPVVAHYKDPNEPDKDITEETKAEFVIKERANMTPRYNAKAGKSGDELSSEVILDKNDKFNRKPSKYTLDSNTFVDDKGNTWNVSIDKDTGKVTATVPDGEGDKIDGALLNVPVKAHYYETDGTEIATKEVEVQFVASGTDGTKTYTEKIPFGYKVEYDPNFYTKYPEATDGYEIVTEGQAGEKKTTLTIKDSQIVDTQDEVTKQPVDALIKVGKKDFTGEIKHTENHEIPFEVEYKYSDELEAGQTKVEQKGEKGSYDVEYSQKIKNGEVDGDPTSKKTNEKAAKNEIVVIGTKPVTKVVEKPFNTEYVYDENLEAGETEEITPGKNGKVTITTTYDKDQNKVVTSETEEAGQNRVVKIGGKTNGTEKITEEIPFEVEVRKDPNLKKGEWKYAIDEDGKELRGEKGEQEKTLTIVNSKVTETSEPTVTKKAKNAVILIGEGTNDGTHDFTEKKELPFETIIEYDDSLEPGEEKVVQEGKPGEQERTNTIVIENGKVKEIKEGTFETITKPVNKIVKIGRKKPDGETTKTIEKEIPYETKVIYDENLEAGFQKIEKEGKPGKEKVTITTKIVDGKLVTTESTEKIEDKEDRVVRIGVKPVVKETELGHDTEYRYNPELKEGEEKVIEEGSNGKVEYTITFNKEKGKIEVTEKRTEPKNKIVEIGYKTDGKVKVESEIPFEVEIIEDPEMEAGKTEVVQEGKLGKKETTVTIENSKEVSREENIIKEPVKKIIKVGTKNVCEIPPVKPENPTDPEKPGEDPKDPEKPGEDPKNPEKPGEDPKDPEKPGEDPKDPEKPGEDPKDPDKDPGKEDSKDPDQPGEDPKDPGKDSGKTPEENGKTPENNGKTPENNGKTPENNGKTPGATGQVDGKSTTTNNKTPKRLPKSGSESEIITLAMSGLLAAAGFIGLKKKRKDQ